MEKTLLWTAYLCASVAIYFADEILALAKRGLARLRGPAPTPAPDGAELEGALRALFGPAGSEPVAAMALLAAQPGAGLTAKLVDVMEGADEVAARRAAQVLFQRQDPVSLPTLFRYFTKHSSAATQADEA